MTVDPQRQAFLEAIGRDRYDWNTRKIFADWLEDKGMDDEALVQRNWTPEWQRAVDWLTDLAKDIGLSYEKLMHVADEFINYGIPLVLDMDGSNRMYDDRDMFWPYYEKASRREFTKDHTLNGFVECEC